MDPKGKVALITGGARIGQVVAMALAQRGCALALTYRKSVEAAQSTAAAARAAGVAATMIRADAEDEAQIKAAVNETVRVLGRLDILINLAGTYVQTPNPGVADWSSAMDSNARSAFLFATAAAPIMKSGEGAASSTSATGCRQAAVPIIAVTCRITPRRPPSWG